MTRFGKYLVFAFVALAAAVVLLVVRSSRGPNPEISDEPSADTVRVLEETAELSESQDPDWWLDSGGRVYFDDDKNEFATIQGSLMKDDRWRKLYAESNPADTDDGLHPQNIFRLVNKGNWRDFTQEAYFRIDAYNPSASPNRNESNGILFFNRYVDGDNLYYVGLRVDGAAVVKKKFDGEYHTLAYEKILPGVYDASTTPNLLPEGVWIGLRSEIFTASSSAVVIKLYVDIGRTGSWSLAVEAVDDGSAAGPKIDQTAYAGVRTDFMDVTVSGYETALH